MNVSCKIINFDRMVVRLQAYDVSTLIAPNYFLSKFGLVGALAQPRRGGWDPSKASYVIRTVPIIDVAGLPSGGLREISTVSNFPDK